MTIIQCCSCKEWYEKQELAHKTDCPDCGTVLICDLGPSRGSAAEILAEERAEAETHEERDVYRTLLHLLACNLLTNKDIHRVIHFGVVTENLGHAFSQAYDSAKQSEEGDVLVCPNCGKTIKSQARWFDPDRSIKINPNRAIL